MARRLTSLRACTPTGRARQRALRGIVLLEAVIATLVAAFGFAALIRSHLALSHHAEVTRGLDRASRAAVQRLEQLHSAPSWRQLADGADTPGPHAGNTLHRRWTVRPDPLDAGLARVVIQVSWHDRQGRERGVRLTGILDDEDPMSLGTVVLARRGLDWIAMTPP